MTGVQTCALPICVAIRTHNDAEFLAREIAGIRIALAALPTSDEIRDQLERIEERLSGSGGNDR